MILCIQSKYCKPENRKKSVDVFSDSRGNVKKGTILLLLNVSLSFSCTSMATNIGYIEPGVMKSEKKREEFEFCSIKYPGLLDRAISELKIKAKRTIFQNVSMSYFSGYLIFNCVRIEYE